MMMTHMCVTVMESDGGSRKAGREENKRMIIEYHKKKEWNQKLLCHHQKQFMSGGDEHSDRMYISRVEKGRASFLPF